MPPRVKNNKLVNPAMRYDHGRIISAAQPITKYIAPDVLCARHVIFSVMPSAAANQIAIKNGTPILRGSASKQTGVYVPAINT